MIPQYFGPREHGTGGRAHTVGIVMVTEAEIVEFPPMLKFGIVYSSQSDVEILVSGDT